MSSDQRRQQAETGQLLVTRGRPTRRPAFLRPAFVDGVVPLSEEELEACVRTVLNTVDVARVVADVQAYGATTSSRRWGQPASVPAHTLHFLNTVKAARLGRMVELETLFDAHRRDPHATDVLESGEEYDEEDEDEDEDEEENDEVEGEDDSVHENPTENGAPSTPSLSGSAPDFSDDLAVYAAVCVHLCARARYVGLPRDTIVRRRRSGSDQGQQRLELEVVARRAPVDPPSARELSRHIPLARGIRRHPIPLRFNFRHNMHSPGGTGSPPAHGTTVNGFFAPKTAGARAPSSPVLERLRGVLTRVLVITTLRGHSAGSTLDIQNSRRWLSAYLVFRGSVDGGRAVCGLKGCGHVLVPPPSGDLLFRNSKRQFRLSVMSIRWRRVCSGDGLHKTLRCSAIYPNPVKIWRWHFDKILLLDWVDLGRVVHPTCKLST
ncbi:hypothetical protein DFH08DRAFT_937791 [Mycena albidolilacea]|uniref:Uncharacterized protein n=1 Tax=Mycena albidolilacea TaxID=1033008 RepID=A0AAD6ZWV4_9AGAR|nr:hypothetical protein DFH08DRAFT_937791 [Mycena albidolilacea]